MQVHDEPRRYGRMEDLGEIVSQTSTHDRYNCPYCLENTGTADTNSKLYINRTEKIGLCFRCETIVIDNSLRTIDEICKAFFQDPSEDLYRLQELNIDGWTTPVFANREVNNYLNQRGIQDQTLERFNVLAARQPVNSVVYVNRLLRPGRTDYLQVRYVGRTRIRHMTVRDLIKPLCWVDHIETDDLIIVEGYTSGLSAWQHTNGQLSPLVLLGKFMSDLRLKQLSKFLNSVNRTINVYICLDGGILEKAFRVANRVHNCSINTNIRLVVLPGKKDPNDVTAYEFNKCLEKSYSYDPLSLQLIRNRVYGANQTQPLLQLLGRDRQGNLSRQSHYREYHR